MYDVVIIGAGVIGAMCAHELAKYNLKICILEKENDVACGSTKANSAIVHAGYDAQVGSLKAKLNVRGSKLMKQITDDLGVKYINNGSLVIGFTEEDKKNILELYDRGIKNGVEKLEILDYDRVHEIEPNLSSDVTCALYAPTAAIICPYALTFQAIGNAMDNGTDLELNFEVEKINMKKDYYEICSKDKTVESKIVINAAGLYSDNVAKMVNDNSFSVHPRRGEYILLDKELGNLVSHTIFRTPSKKGKGILITPTVDGNLLAGPTSLDIDCKENVNTTDLGFELIIENAKENLPSIDFSKSITSFCGLRSVGSTGDFIINSPLKGFINVAGIESPGLSAAPAIAEYIREMLEKDYQLVLRSNHISKRKPMHFFEEASIEEKNKIIKGDNSYGRIICRCEGVTEGEILNAIRTNPKPRDLDGIKRRTRAQMGRCQGGFCTPYIMDILAKEMNVDLEKVSKNGLGSELVFSKTKGGAN